MPNFSSDSDCDLNRPETPPPVKKSRRPPKRPITESSEEEEMEEPTSPPKRKRTHRYTEPLVSEGEEEGPEMRDPPPANPDREPYYLRSRNRAPHPEGFYVDHPVEDSSTETEQWDAYDPQDNLEWPDPIFTLGGEDDSWRQTPETHPEEILKPFMDWDFYGPVCARYGEEMMTRALNALWAMDEKSDYIEKKAKEQREETTVRLAEFEEWWSVKLVELRKKWAEEAEKGK